jgi:hypothetical protein
MLVGLSFIFRRGNTKLCAIGQHSQTNIHLWVDLFETYAFYSIGNPRWKAMSLLTCANNGHVKGNIKQAQMVDCLTCDQDFSRSCYKCCHVCRPLRTNHSSTFWKMFLHLVIFNDEFWWHGTKSILGWQTNFGGCCIHGISCTSVTLGYGPI